MNRLHLALSVVLSACVGFAAPVLAQTAASQKSKSINSLGEALYVSPDLLKSPDKTTSVTLKAPVPTTGLSVDPFSRSDVANFYHCTYLASENFADDVYWTGDLASCDAGTVSDILHEHTLRRINYYRAMAGLNADITFDAAKSAKSQKAALLMARNGQLSHYPPTSWLCYSQDGYDAAGSSNISLGYSTNPNSSGNYGPNAVNGQMEDDGDNNLAVGHRRWLLYSKAKVMGNGAIPVTASPDNPGVYYSSASIWVIGDFNSTVPAGVDFIAWPSAGYVPHQVVWPRWSFGIPNSTANFGSATVTLSKGGTNIPVNILHRGSAGVGDPTIVWQPTGEDYPNYPSAVPTEDTEFTVTISGITGAPQSSYTYSVTVINPNDPGDLTITGSANPVVGVANTYDFTPMENVDGYEVKVSSTQTGNWVEGAEDGSLDALLDSTSIQYDYRISDPTNTGNYSFHLTFPSGDTSEQSFTIDRYIIPSAESELNFHNLRRWSATGSKIRAQISTDGGAFWTTVWERAGNGENSSSQWDISFQPVQVSLADYADEVISLRFVYQHESGGYYGGIESGFGFFIDDIYVSHSQELAGAQTFSLDAEATSFDITPATDATLYFLQIRPLTDCHEYSFGQTLAVTSTGEPAGTLFIDSLVMNSGQIDLDFSIVTGEFSTFMLQRSTDLDTWVTDNTASLVDHGDGNYSFSTTLPLNEAEVFYRVTGE